MPVKCAQNLLGHGVAWRGRSLEVRLPLIRSSASELPQTAGETAVETEFDTPKKPPNSAETLVETPQKLHKDKMTPQRPERSQKTSRNFTDAGRLNTPMSTADSIPTKSAADSSEHCRIPTV